MSLHLANNAEIPTALFLENKERARSGFTEATFGAVEMHSVLVLGIGGDLRPMARCL